MLHCFLSFLWMQTKNINMLYFLDYKKCEKFGLSWVTSVENLQTQTWPILNFKKKKKNTINPWSANTLQFLDISYCENLAVLLEWLPNLSSLCKLQILFSPKLLSLPEGMDHLTALRELKIIGCPKLRRNYEWEVGSDRSNSLADR